MGGDEPTVGKRGFSHGPGELTRYSNVIISTLLKVGHIPDPTAATMMRRVLCPASFQPEMRKTRRRSLWHIPKSSLSAFVDVQVSFLNQKESVYVLEGVYQYIVSRHLDPSPVVRVRHPRHEVRVAITEILICGTSSCRPTRRILRPP